MEFKFVRTPLMITAGVIWLGVAVMNLYMIAMMMAPFSFFMAFLPLVTSILAGILGFYYLTLYKRNYIVINEESMLVHKGMIYKNKQIFFKDIEAIMERGNNIRIQERSGKETKIVLNMLELKGIKELRSVFEKKCKCETMN